MTSRLQPGHKRCARLIICLTIPVCLTACRAGQPVTLPPMPAVSAQEPTLGPSPILPSATVPAPTLATIPPTPTETPVLPTATPYPQATIVAVGDVMMGRMVNKISLQQNDFSWPFASLGAVLSSADLTVGNLESPLVPDCPVDGIGMRLCGSTRAAQALGGAGFDVMGFSNNHSHDFGPEGQASTIEALSQAGLLTVYDGVPWLGNINGVTIGILAYDDVNRDLDLDRVRAEAAAFAQQADVLIGVVHWGYEYRPNPSIRQMELAHLLADSGMRVIIGSHPHWIQPMETYGNSDIFYSLGNFVFDQTWSEKTREGLMVRLTITKTENGATVTYDLIPIRIEGYGEPQPVDSVSIPALTP